MCLHPLDDHGHLRFWCRSAELKEARHRERNGLNAGWHAQPDSSSSQQFKKDRIDASTSRRFKVCRRPPLNAAGAAASRCLSSLNILSNQSEHGKITATPRSPKGDCMEVIVGERTDDVRVVWWPDEKDPVETVVEVCRY